MKTEIDLDQQLINTLKSLKAEEDANPSVVFRNNAKIRIMNQITEASPTFESKRNFALFRKPAFRFAGVLVLLLLVLSTGTILAAQGANPNSQLYPIKLASENAVMAALPNSPLKANVALAIAQRRAEEINSEKQTGNITEIKKGIQRYSQSITSAKSVSNEINNSNFNRQISEQENNLNKLILEYENKNGEGKENQNKGVQMPENGQSIKGDSIQPVENKEQNTQQDNNQPNQSNTEQNQTLQKTNADNAGQNQTGQTGNNYLQQNLENNLNSTEKGVENILNASPSPKPSDNP